MTAPKYPFSYPYALKEWDAQTQALSSGQTALILRKGGITETRDQFEVEHLEFFLYPTFLHQNPLELRPDFAALLRPQPVFGQVCIPARAKIRKVWKIENLEAALTLEPFQALTAQSITNRFHYRNKPVLHALLLEVFPLPRAVCLPETDTYLGCLSWVPLGQDVTQPSKAVLDQAELLRLEGEINTLLGGKP